MKKITILLLALAMLCTCFALAACGDDGDTSSAASSTSETSSATSTASSAASSASSAASSAASTSSEASSATSSTAPVPQAKVFWVTHYNDTMAEGAGVIFTESDTAGGWSTHVAFAPVEGQEGVWEIKAISLGVGTGQATTVEVPEGGFVYALNIGNDWPKLVAENPGTYDDHANDPNYTTTICNNLGQTEMPRWKVGDKFKIEGLTAEDIANLKVPTSTADTPWYEDGYVCTATYTVVS